MSGKNEVIFEKITKKCYFCMLQEKWFYMPEDLRSNITRLIALYEGEKKRADDAEAQLAERNKEIASCNLQIAELNRQIDNQRLTSAISAAGDNPEAKQRLTKLIAEIDKCIALLEA